MRRLGRARELLEIPAHATGCSPCSVEILEHGLAPAQALRQHQHAARERRDERAQQMQRVVRAAFDRQRRQRPPLLLPPLASG